VRLGVLQVEALRAALLELSGFADKVEQGAADGLPAMQAWLRQTEDLCKGLHLAATGDLAALRAELAQAARGIATSSVPIAGRITRRKIRTVALSRAISRSNEVIQSSLRTRSEQLEECERIASQIAAVVVAKGYEAAARQSPTNEGYLSALELLIRNDGDLLSAWTHLVGMAGPTDAKILLHRALP
jgi:hypothetical protein